MSEVVYFNSDGKVILTGDDAIAKKTKDDLRDDLRIIRNDKLAETDWVVIKEREEGGSVSNFADCKKYR